MKLYGALVLFLTLSTACGLRCFTCTGADPHSCTNTKTCPLLTNRCFSQPFGPGIVTKGCLNSLACVFGFVCCEGDFCNSAIPTGPSALLLLVSSALVTVLL